MAGLAALALVAGLSGLTAAPAAAFEDPDHVALPKTGYAAEVAAASGTGIIVSTIDDESAYLVSTDNGHTFTNFSAPQFRAIRVRSVASGKVVYVEEGQGDDAGDFSNVYIYDLATGVTAPAVRVDAAEVAAADAMHAIVVSSTVGPPGYDAVPLAGGIPKRLDVSVGGGWPAVSIGTDRALAVTVNRNVDGTVDVGGHLHSAPLSGAPGVARVVDHVVTGKIGAGTAYWVTATSAKAELCSASAATIDVATPTCKTLASGDYSHAVASLEVGPGWVVARLRPVSGGTLTQFVYLPGTNSLTKVAPSAGTLSIDAYGRGDTATPLATVVADAGSYVGTYSAGAVTPLFNLPEITATPSALFVTPQSVSGLDDRPAAGVNGQQAWRRDFTEAGELGSETRLSPRASAMTVSGDRTLITDAEGAHVSDGGDTVRAIAGVTDARSLSGPYFLSGPASNADVMRVDGTTALTSAGNVIALFGSLALRTEGAGYAVVDATRSATEVGSVDFAACTGTSFEAVGLWGDWVLAKDTDSGGTAVLNYRDGTCEEHDGAPRAIGEGFALITPLDVDSNEQLLAWNFVNGDTDPLAINPSLVATDGWRTVAWTTSSELWKADISNDAATSPSAPRVLGILADPTVPSGSPWTLDLDASKGLQESALGLELRSGTEVVRRIAVPESPNGAARLVWDGKIDGQPAPMGDYTWELKVNASDNTGALVNTDGSSRVTGTLAVGAPLPSVTPGTLVPWATELFIGSELTVLTAKGGPWAPSSTTLTYQWYRDGVAIPGATSQTYTAGENDATHALTVEVTGSADGYNPVTVTSDPTSVVKDTVEGTVPTLSTSAPIVGKAISATPGVWGPAGVDLAYQWYRDATAIPGEDKASYTPLAADLGHALKVEVTGRKPPLNSLTLTSASTSAVVNGTFVKTVPTLSTTRLAVDQTVTAVTGNWGTGDVKFAYQWYRVKSKSKAIAGATGAAYRVVAKDVGYKLKVKVTGTVAGVGTATLYSRVSSKVKKATFVMTTPLSITGVAKVGQPLTFSGAWSVQPTLKYQWYRGSKAIKRAKAATYVLTAADLRKVMKVKVTGTRSGYNTVVKTVKLATPVGPAV